MDNENEETIKSISISKKELETMMQQVAQDAAALALGAVGLSDENAGKDIQDIRALIQSYRVVKATVWKTLLKTVLEKFAGYFVVAVMAVLAVKCSIDLDKLR